MAALRATRTVGSVRTQELLRRGWQHLEVADLALNPPRRLASGSADTPAWQLSRSALHWGLAAARTLGPSDSAASDADPSLAVLLASADRETLWAAAGGEAEWNTLAASLEHATFSSFAELSVEEQQRQARSLWAFTRSLLAKLEEPRIRLDRLWLQRVVRSGGVALLFLLLVGGTLLFQGRLESARNLARDKPWKTSSVAPGTPACDSPEQECSNSPQFFFHTTEEDQPWIVIDLKSSQRFSAVRVRNREDCCTERAAPLVVEVSSNQNTWKQVARREDTFTNWYQSFDPVTARYVRVRAAKKTSLHLSRISVLR